MIIERFINEYAEETSKLIQTSLRKVCSQYYPISEVEKYCNYYSPNGIINLSNEQEMWILQYEDSIKGMVSRKDNTIEMCYVLPEIMRKGFGNVLMNKIELEIIKDAKLGAAKNAVEFYKSRGYKIYGESEGDILMQKQLN